MLLSNLTNLLNRDYLTGNKYPYFITHSHSFSQSREDCSTVETIHIDINSAALQTQEDDALDKLDLTVDQFITYLRELGLQGHFKYTTQQWVTYIQVHTSEDADSDITQYITIVKTDLSIIINLIDPAL